jgi:hypothetical protein
MGLDLWFRDDVMRILASTHETIQACSGAVGPISPELSEAYRQGFVDALRVVAIAFGVAAPGLRHVDRDRLPPELSGHSVGWPG